MDERNEYRTRDSGYSSLPVRLEFRPWRKSFGWFGRFKGMKPGEWESLSIYPDDDSALAAAKLHAATETPVNVKDLGRLP